LEHQYGLLESFKPTEFDRLTDTLRTTATDLGAKQVWLERRDHMLADKVDVTAWYLRLLKDLLERRRAASAVAH
jgi:predicted N-formylglutamate amidohydrolase